MSLLRRAGLVRVVKGNKGGFFLAKPSDQISICDILKAVEGDLEIVDCVGPNGFCDRMEKCEARNIWGEASLRMIDYLDSITLADVVKKEMVL